MRGTTPIAIRVPAHLCISTHVPRAGHDSAETPVDAFAEDFNSRAPCGARRIRARTVISLQKFQLTCPVRGTTTGFPRLCSALMISTHVPRAGHDIWRTTHSNGRNEFQLTCPVRGTTGMGYTVCDIFANFNSRAPCGARRLTGGRIYAIIKFQLTCPVRGTTAVLQWAII